MSDRISPQVTTNTTLALQTVPVTNQDVLISGASISTTCNRTISTTKITSVNTFGTTVTNTSQQSNLSNSTQQDILFVESTNKNSRVVLSPFDNSINISKSDSDLRESLYESIGSIDNLSFTQQNELIDYVDINKPAVMNDNNVVMTYYDIFGTEYYDGERTLNIFSGNNNTYFALTAYITKYSETDNDIIFDTNSATKAINQNFKVFKLYQDLQKTSYFVYAFEDIPNDQIVYNKYLGAVNWVNGVPMGNEVPKYENLVKTTTIDPDTLQLSSYLSSAKIRFNNSNGTYNYQKDNGKFIGNVILKEILIPEMELTIQQKNENDKTIITTYSSVDIDNDLFKTELQDNYEHKIIFNGNNSGDFISYLSECISSYSLYSKINIINEYIDYDYSNFTRKVINKAHIKPITLYVPTVIYTEVVTNADDNNYYQYVPYERIDEESNITISTKLEIDDVNNTAIVSFDEFKFKWSNEGIKCREEIRDEDGNIERDKNGKIKFSDDYNKNIITQKIEDREYIFINSFDDKYSVFFRVNILAQDEDLNFVEYDIDNSLNIDEPENNIFHILVYTPGDIYVQKLTLNDGEEKKIPLFNRQTIKINPVNEFQLFNMSYMDYLNIMTTSYNIEYVAGIDNNYGWKYDPNVSSIRYVTDVLFERESLNVTYSYWSPKDNSYVPYTNNVLEYDGNYYGSNIYDSTYIQDFINNAYVISNYHYIADVKLIQVYKRTKLSGEASNTPFDNGMTIDRSSFKDSKGFIKDNEELKYKTYSNIPFELKNQSDLFFTGEYSFIPPEMGYIVNQEESNDIETAESVTDAVYVVTNISYIQSNSYSYYCAAYYNLTIKSGNYPNSTYLSNSYSILLSGITLEELSKQINSNPKTSSFQDNETITSASTLYATYQPDKFASNSFYTNERLLTIKINEGEPSISYSSIFDIIKNENCYFDNLSRKFYFSFNDNNRKYQISISPQITYNSYFTNNINQSEKVKNIIKQYVGVGQNFGTNNTYAYEKTKSELNKDGNCSLTVYYDAKDIKFFDIGTSYTISQVITTDGYWKPNYTEVIKPFTTVSYSFASNSIDISNAYIVPTTKNEPLGFIHNPRITYNSFITSYVSEYKYTYVNEFNIQCNYAEDADHKIFTVGDKYYGLSTKYGSKSKAFGINNEKQLCYYDYSDIGNGTLNTLSCYGLKSNNVDKLETTITNPYNNETTITYNIINCEYNESISTITIEGKQLYSFPPYGINSDELKSDIYNYFVLEKISEIDTTKKPWFSKIGNPKLLFKKVNNTYSAYFLTDAWIFSMPNRTMAISVGTIDSFTTPRKVGDLIELHRRLCVSKSKSLQEVVYQEEEWIPQNAQIDTPFGVVNGKKVVVTDEVLVPATYTEVISIDPNTYEYFSKRVVLTEEHYAYTYEIEDIPLITAAYIYNNEDGIKIQGMDTLVEVLSGMRTGIDNEGNSYIIPSTLPSSSLTNLSFDKMTKSFNSYMSRLSYSLIYINSAIDRTSNNIGYVAYVINGKNNDNIGKVISDAIYKDSQDTINANKTNVSNSINSQKSMFNRLTQSIDNQTSTLSKMMMISLIGNSSSYTTEGASLISNMLNSISGTVPQNWQSVEETGYQYTYQTLVNAYKATSYKHTKVIGRDLRSSSYATRTGTYLYENPAYVTLTYSIYGDKYLNSSERIGLHLKKETRNFTYNGYVYKEDYYSYQNIADILADLHISNRLPNRKEFIVDVSKRLYINSDFIFSYTSPNEYAIRAIRRADILWNELVKANVVEDSKSNQRPLPEIPKNRIYWWKNRLFLRQFASIFDLNYRKLLTLRESEFVKIDSIIRSKIGIQLVPIELSNTVSDFVITDSSKRPNISGTVVNAMSAKVTTTNRTRILANMFGVTYESMKENPEVISEIRTLTSPYKNVLSLGELEKFEQLKIKV